MTVTGKPTEDAAIQTEAEKVSKVHAPVSHPFKYHNDWEANIIKKISIRIKFPDGVKVAKTGIRLTEL